MKDRKSCNGSRWANNDTHSAYVNTTCEFLIGLYQVEKTDPGHKGMREGMQ